MSYKNILQEIYQKNPDIKSKYKLTYNTFISSGQSHTPVFQCELEAFGKIFTTELNGKKVDSEQESAKKAIDYYNSHFQKRNVAKIRQKNGTRQKSKNTEILCSQSTKIIVFVDCENVTSELSLFKDLLPAVFEDTEINLCFSNTTKHAIKPKVKNLNGINIKCSPSTRKDAADLLICIEIGRIFERKEICEILIITKDHFGDTIKDIISEYGKIDPDFLETVSIKCIRSVKKLIKILNNKY